MMSSGVYKVEGIILKRKNVGEADRILTVFSKEYGKLRVIAKGIRKVSSRRAPHLEVFTHVAVVIHGSTSLESVSEVSPIETFPYLRSDLARVSLGYYLCELVDSLLPERQKHEDIFILLQESLASLNDQHFNNIYYLSKQFTLELLWRLGFLPRDRTLNGPILQNFIESITERRLKTPPFARQIMKDTKLDR